MNEKIKSALDSIDSTYKDLREIADEQIKKICGDVNDVVSNLQKNLHTLSNDDIDKAMLDLSTKSFFLADIEERSEFRAEIAETLRKERYASVFNESTGTVGQKENTAVIESSSEILAEEIYNLVASTLKSKRDEIHRVVDTLKSVRINRTSEAKLSMLSDTNEIEPTTNRVLYG